MKTVLSWMAVLLTLALPLSAQGDEGKKAEKSALRVAWEKLLGEYRKASGEYNAPLRKAKSREEADKIRAAMDPAKNPANEYLGKFQAFAKDAKGKPEAIEALINVVGIARTLPVKDGEKRDFSVAQGAFKELVNDYASMPEIEMFASFVPRYADTIGLDAKGEAKAFIERTKAKGAKAAAMNGLADFLTASKTATDEDKKLAESCYAKLESEYADTEFGKRAIGKKFARENLVVGKAAPDESSKDENGVAFKVSDYKGKVVVLDFWGIW